MADPQPQPPAQKPAPVKHVATREELDAKLDAPDSNMLQYLGVAFVSLTLAFVVLKGLDFLATSAQPKSAKPPRVPERCVFRPEFETDAAKFSAGSAFGTKLPGDNRRLLVTALHLIKGVPAEELAAKLKRVSLKDAFAEDQSLGAAQGALTIATAAPYKVPPEPGDVAGDVAAVWATSDTFFETLPLAGKNPEKGDSVWLIAAVKNAPATERLHRAVVDGVIDGVLVYWFDNDKLDLTGTGGAPLVNAAGEVVGIALGGGPDGGKLSGFANPIDRFRAALVAAGAPPATVVVETKGDPKKVSRPAPPK